jgi:hypothetical protein
MDNSIDSISIPLTEENHMLKNEIRTLNNEMSLLQYKLKTADKGKSFGSLMIYLKLISCSVMCLHGKLTRYGLNHFVNMI